MRDYIKILTRITNEPWLITAEGLEVILGIINERLNHGQLSDAEIAARLEAVDGRDQPNELQRAGNGDIGVLPIHGPIFGKANLFTKLSGATSLETFAQDFNAMMNDNSIESLILDFDSPGGEADLIQETGDLIFNARDIKPIYAIANTDAGSAAYWLMSQATPGKLYSTTTGKVGSIGVYTVHEDRSGSDQQNGRRFTYVSAGPYKTEGNPHEPLSTDAKSFIQEIIDDLYADFLGVVARGRGITADEVKANYGGGRMMPAKQAKKAGMVDGITTFDKLIAQIADKPKPVSVFLPGQDKAFASGFLSSAGLTFSDNSVVKYIREALKLESKELEHSEPGTGSPPAPRTDQDGSDDKAIAEGWRRNAELPLNPGDPGAPSPNGEAFMTEEQLKELRKTLGLSAEATETEILAAVASLAETNAQLSSAVGAVSQEMKFKNEYPEMYAQHQKLIATNRGNEARDFVASIQHVTRVVGDKTENTNFGLSALAMQTIEEIHCKFATGEASLADFENVLSAVMHSGILEYGERGSSRDSDVADVVINTETTTGLSNARTAFAQKVTEIMEKDKIDYRAAVAQASKLYPDLAQAWAVSGVR